jgi:hypothetical protein
MVYILCQTLLWKWHRNIFCRFYRLKVAL